MITRTHTKMHKHLQDTGRQTIHTFKKMQTLTDVHSDKSKIKMTFIECEVLVSSVLTLLSCVVLIFLLCHDSVSF